MKKLNTRNYFALFVLFGLTYLLVEVIWGALVGSTSSPLNMPYWSLVGRTSLWMFPVGGVLGLFLGLFNEMPFIRKNLNVFWQALFGSLFILLLELLSGIILNIWLGFGIWNYNSLPLNLMGQISLPFGVAWFFLCPFAFWLDDYIKFYIYDIGNTYNVFDVYRDLFKVRKKTEYQL